MNKPANDNREPRAVQNWPTGKRLLQAGRREDHAMLVAYRDLLDMAFGEPANDGWRDPPPEHGRQDTRAMEERMGQRDMILDEASALPTLEELRDLSGVPWGDDADPIDQRPTLAMVDRAGVARRRLGGLEFINGAYLYRYGDLDNPDQRKQRKPIELRRPHRAPRSHANIVPTSGSWSLEDQIDARQRVRSIWEKLPASSVRILEHALGSLKAQELGEVFSKNGKTAQRFGVRLIDRAIDHLRLAWCPLIAPHA
ncbi:hypothetical protein [Devosia elaeis]|uniref:Uncharacterized protein n=1 Tax=Devosia elaeis TaxID=1770058 RepID=A0A178I0P2_9HYPH|nr:hypothetical protein [Devosia elaeis]OAM77768.1 hypothetical protein A3840_08465 [Devosia elaeis]